MVMDFPKAIFLYLVSFDAFIATFESFIEKHFIGSHYNLLFARFQPW